MATVKRFYSCWYPHNGRSTYWYRPLPYRSTRAAPNDTLGGGFEHEKIMFRGLLLILGALSTSGDMSARYPKVGRLLQQAEVLLGDPHTQAKAIEAFREAVAEFPDAADAHSALAIALSKTHATPMWHADSVRAFKKAAELTPTNGHFQFNAAMALAQDGQHTTALKHIYRAVKAAPSKPRYLLQTAKILTRMSESKDVKPKRQRFLITNSIKYLKSFLRLAPSRDSAQSAAARHMLADALANVTRYDEAALYYRRVITDVEGLPDMGKGAELARTALKAMQEKQRESESKSRKREMGAGDNLPNGAREL